MLVVVAALNPSTQYADDTNLRARQRLWEHVESPFDLVGWVLGLAEVDANHRLLDVGCGNGFYLRELASRGLTAVGCDLSLGMLRTASPWPALVNADAQALSFGDAAFDAVLAPHMLYHVPDRVAAAHELRRVLRPGGVCVAVTNGDEHLRSLRELAEAATTRRDGARFEMLSPSMADFSLENGADQLRVAFDTVELVRPEGRRPVRVTDADVVADYVASTGDHYEHEVDRPWAEVVEHVRRAAQAIIDRDGEFVTSGDTGAFVCR